MKFNTTCHAPVVLTLNEDQKLYNLAAIANRIMKNNRSEICEVSSDKRTLSRRY